MAQRIPVIQLDHPQLRFAGGYKVLDAGELAGSSPSTLRSLALICPICFSPVSIRSKVNGPEEEDTEQVTHLGDNYGCSLEGKSSSWVSPILKTPNTFIDISSSLNAERKLNDDEINSFRTILSEKEDHKLCAASTVASLAHLIRHHGPSLARMPFNLLGSSTNSWGDLIVSDLNTADDVERYTSDRRIFRGIIDSEILKQDERIVLFRCEKGGIDIKCKVPFSDDDNQESSYLPDDFYYRHQGQLEILVLGSPILDDKFTATISTPSRRYLCISPIV